MFVHITPVEQILVSSNNQMMVTQSSDSVFIWNISQRVALDPLQATSSLVSKLQKQTLPLDKITESPTFKPMISSKTRPEPDDVAKYRKEREILTALLLASEKSALSYLNSDVQPFKKEILYYSTLLKRSKPKLDLLFKCSYGLDTR